MNSAAYCVFDTPIRECAIAWRESGESMIPTVLWFQLPEATVALTESRMAQKSGARKSKNPPPQISALIEKIQRHLRGELQDFGEVEIDLSAAAPFARQVLEAARKIPPGRTATYGELARSVGRPDAARAVGQVMASNPVPLLIPCHRVAAANGKSGGFSAPGGRMSKAELLAIERAATGLLFSRIAGH